MFTYSVFLIRTERKLVCPITAEEDCSDKELFIYCSSALVSIYYLLSYAVFVIA